jgi:hypothetical protein
MLHVNIDLSIVLSQTVSMFIDLPCFIVQSTCSGT